MKPSVPCKPIYRNPLFLTHSPFVPSERAFTAIAHFLHVLDDWKGIKQLVGPLERKQILWRHVFDSLQLLSLVPTATRWLDVGTGNGFPAVVIASILIDSPKAYVCCVESDQRKCAFITTVAREINLPLILIPRRIEDVQPSSIQQLEVITARAFRKLRLLIDIALPYLVTGATGIFPVGSKSVYSRDECIPIEKCRAEWFSSCIDPRSTIIRVSCDPRTQF